MEKKQNIKEMNHIVIIRSLALFVSLLLIIVGIMYHQPDFVLAKAINICLECVGIG